jgi:hypothetical protein
MWNGCREMRERGRERNGEKYWMKTERDTEKEGQNGKRKRWGIDRKMFSFWNCCFYF